MDQLGYSGRGVEGGVAGGAVAGRLAAASEADASKGNKEEARQAPASLSPGAPEAKKARKDGTDGEAQGLETGPLKGATVRKTFADTALFVAAVDTTDEGVATVTVPFPQNLTTWRIKTLGMTKTTRVGQGEGSVITSKDFIVRLAAPRFFTERDEVVLSANVHNYLKTAKKARVTLSLPPELLELSTPATATVDVKPDGEARVDWKVKAKAEGLASIKVEALTDEESDATEMAFPVLVHGFVKTVSVTGSVRPDGPSESTATISVPAERRPDRSQLSIRVSPSLGLAMVDALPYLIDYPYGCTEQTMSRFVPAVLTRKTLQKMGVNLADLEEAHTNLNSQQVGGHRYDTKDPYNPPVYSEKELKKVIKASLKRISEMQRGDGGWGWWADDTPSTYLTAYVVWGLIEARDADVSVDSGMLSRGIAALASGVRRDMLDWEKWDGIGNEQAWLAYVLSTARNGEVPDPKVLKQTLDLVFERRIHLSLYGKALLSLALRNSGDVARADLVLENARQKEQKDPENETVFYPIEADGWWYWWNSDIESQAWVLRAILAKNPRDPAAPGMVKWLLNNRKNGTYWRSTRDTAIVVSAFAEYVQATGETEPDMTVKVAMDGKVLKEMRITKANLFTFDNVAAVAGADLTTGDHKITITREGKGPVYWNAECSYFTLEENVKKAGLEIKVERAYWKLERDDATVTVPGSRLEAVTEKRVRYKRIPLKDGDRVTTGDLLEIELKMTSKNDYDYLVFEDPKPAGCEPVEVRSGARFGELCSNMELRDEKVAFFVSWLDKGDHLIRYRLRAEAPGTFHTLPTRGYAMYAPELRCNGDEIVFGVNDREP
ncbi:MAG: alpha-2-macroglobulin family protein [Acidobacteriota bacterium]